MITTGITVSKKFVRAVYPAKGLMQKRRPTKAELSHCNALWQADVTYTHIPGHGWWYAVTVIDDYSHYLLACHLTSSFSAAEVGQRRHRFGDEGSGAPARQA